MVLEKGTRCFLPERFAEIGGPVGQGEQLADEPVRSGFQVPQHTQPDSFMLQKQPLPLVEHGCRDGITAAQPLHGPQPKEILGQYPQDEQQTVGAVREDRVGMPATAAPHPLNPGPEVYNLASLILHETACVAGMRGAISLGPACWTDTPCSLKAVSSVYNRLADILHKSSLQNNR